MKALKLWLAAVILCFVCPGATHAAWQRHTIDATSHGADGVRLADVNGDQLPDVATGWEQGGVVRVYLHPGTENVTQAWPHVTVGRVEAPEDAVLVDLDGDGAWEVVSSCEGKTRTTFVHWAPKRPAHFLQASAWQTDAIPLTKEQEQWMFALPLKRSDSPIPFLILGSKGNHASVTALSVPTQPRQLNAWRSKRLYNAGWIMSLRSFDMDQDGDQDVLVSDRKGSTSGVLWLEQPEAARAQTSYEWPVHRIGADNQEVMFLDVASHPGSQHTQVAVYAKPNQVYHWTQFRTPNDWREQHFQIDAQIGSAKAIRYADIDGDGALDFVATCEHARGDRIGAFWFPLPTDGTKVVTEIHDISGPSGTKFDRIEVVDLDQDGDLDVMTCEEVENLGVIWYENPRL